MNSTFSSSLYSLSSAKTGNTGMLFLFEKILNCLVEQNFLLKEHKLLTKNLKEQFEAVHSQITERIVKEIKSLPDKSKLEILKKLSSTDHEEDKNKDTDVEEETASLNDGEFGNQSNANFIEDEEISGNHSKQFRDILRESVSATIFLDSDLDGKNYENKSHVPKPQLIYGCVICKKTLTSQAALRKHHNSAHLNKCHKIYKCDMCDAAYSTNSHLSRHRKKHFPETWFQCKFCSSKFQQKSHLRDHIRIHTGERPYKCHLCPQQFKQNSTLKEHVSFVHEKKPRKKPNQNTSSNDTGVITENKFGNDKSMNRNLKLPDQHKSDENEMQTPEEDFELPEAYNFEEFSSESKTDNSDNMTSTVIEIDELDIQNSPQDLNLPEILTSQETLPEHQNNVQIDNSNDLFRCEFCDLVLSSRAYLQRHKRKHLPKSLHCDLCSSKFQRKSHLRDHIRIHTGEKPYKCQNCPRRFTQKSTLKTHVSFVHEKKARKKLNCTSAKNNEQDDSMNVLFGDQQTNDKKQIQSTQKNLFYECEECSKILFTHESLRKHYNSAHPDKSDKIFKCELCSAAFSCRAYLCKHRKKHFPETWLQCEFCPSTFQTKHHLIDHLRIHTGERPFMCDLCPKRFKQNSTLKEHILFVHEKKPRKKANSSTGTDNQIDGKEGLHNDKQFIINSENEVQTSNVDLRVVYSFEECSEILTSQEDFPEQDDNDETNPLKCELCEVVLSSRAHLRRHRKKHFPETWFQCEFCPSKFQQKSHLKDHHRIHTDERPFKCQICSQEFRQKSSLKCHVLFVHEKKPRKKRPNKTT